MILDGWGYREETEANAIALGDTPCWDEMWSSDPHTLIETSGEAVGLPPGQMGWSATSKWQFTRMGMPYITAI